jgi:hypothetical protein
MRDGNACVIGLHHWSFAEEGDFVSENRAVRSSLILGDLRLNGFNSREC